MIAVADSTGLLVVALGALATALWGAQLSVRSARHGPAWALAHVRVAAPWFLAATVFGVVLAVVVRPRWVGAGLLYITAVGWVLSTALGRTLRRVEAEVGLAPPSEDRRRVLLARARLACWLGAAGLLGLGLYVGGAIRVGGLLLGAILAVTGWAVGRS